MLSKPALGTPFGHEPRREGERQRSRESRGRSACLVGAFDEPAVGATSLTGIKNHTPGRAQCSAEKGD
jgi:hypothetical protein